MRRFLTFALALLCLCLAGVSCSDAPVPKPRGYFRITLPEHSYVKYEEAGSPFSFDRSSLTKIVAARGSQSKDSWFNIFYPQFNCRVHVTYLTLNSQEMEDMAYEDDHTLVFKHTVAADAIEGSYYTNEDEGVYAAFYNIRGNAATPTQFSITDSIGHIFRGSLYFYCHPNKDSLAPVVKYVDEDINRLIESFRWNH